MLLRAAQVTLRDGKSHFVFDSRDTRADVRYTAFPEPDMYRPAPFWGPGWSPGYWRFRPRWGYDPFGPPMMISSTTRYQAFAEIVILKPGQEAQEARAVDARAVAANLRPPPPPPPV